MEKFTAGYPVDLRSPARVARCAAGAAGDFEGMAARVMARLTGERVVLQDDGSSDAMPDIRIERAGRPAAYGEVVADLDAGYASMQAAVTKTAFLPADRIWWARTSARADIRVLREQLPPLLNALTGPPGPDLARQLSRLGVEIAGPGEPTPRHRGGIRLHPQGITGSPGGRWEVFLEYLATFLTAPATSDVRRKLGGCGAAERHAFIGLSFTSPGDAFFALNYDGRPGLPPRDPVLPPEITHLWVWTVPGISRCLAWFPDRGWLDPMDHWATA